MDLIRNHPRHQLAGVRGFQNQANRLFDEFFNTRNLELNDPLEAAKRSEEVGDAWVPNVDVSEDEKHYHINVELPGVEKDNVSVTLEHGRLTVMGERPHESEQESGKHKDYHRVEGAFGKFRRSFRVPEGVNEEDIEAQFRDGLLHLLIPKKHQEKGGKVNINVK
jgi:HSP20 family protein